MTLGGGAEPVGWVTWLSYEGIETLGLVPISDTEEPVPGRPFHYVVFGLGQRCEAVGKTMANAPVHYSTESLLGPLERYAHLLVVYEIPGAGPARLAAVAADYAAWPMASLIAPGPVADHFSCRRHDHVRPDPVRHQPHHQRRAYRFIFSTL